MKTRTLLLSLLLTGTALALMPPAQAAEIPGPVVCVTDPCPPYPTPVPNWCTLEQATPGPNPYYTPSLRELLWGSDAGCDVDAEGPDMICAPPSSTGIDQTVGPVHVHAAVCDGGIPDRIPPIATASAVQMQPPIYCVMAPCPGPYPPPAVSWCTVKSATPGTNPYTTLNPRATVWGTDSGCDIDADTTDIYTCAPPSGSVVDRTIGPLHVVLLVCDGGIGDLLGPLN